MRGYEIGKDFRESTGFSAGVQGEAQVVGYPSVVIIGCDMRSRALHGDRGVWQAEHF